MEQNNTPGVVVTAIDILHLAQLFPIADFYSVEIRPKINELHLQGREADYKGASVCPIFNHFEFKRGLDAGYTWREAEAVLQGINVRIILT